MILHYLRRLALVLAIVLLISLPCAAAPAPKNIILLIGDGMGFGQLTAAFHEYEAKGQSLVLSSMPVAGFSVTRSASSLVTDSAAGATALSSGSRTNNGVIALTPDGKQLKTILEIARDMGKSTGLTTTDRITGATPSGFVAHVKNRGMGEEIAGQIVASRINIAFGYENRFFVPEDGRKDGRDITVDAKKRGFDVVSSKEAMDKSNSDRILGLFKTLPTLEEMTAKAISVLNRNSKGF
ncbi:MAG: alkaline phosphatase, partial [Lentisphaerae bacterium]|nr:alkaline phosphatase [Lentisphaerota bacterium]